MTAVSRRLLVVFVAFAVLVGACGGDDDAAQDATTDTPAATTTAAPPAGAGDGGSVDLGDVFSGDCRDAVGGVAAAMGAYTTGLASAFTGQLDESELEAAEDQLRRLSEEAPDELKDDLDVIANALAEFYRAFADIGFDPSGGQTPTPEQIEQLGQIAEQFDSADLQAAGDNVTAWFAANCN